MLDRINQDWLYCWTMWLGLGSTRDRLNTHLLSLYSNLNNVLCTLIMYTADQSINQIIFAMKKKGKKQNLIEKPQSSFDSARDWRICITVITLSTGLCLIFSELNYLLRLFCNQLHKQQLYFRPFDLLNDIKSIENLSSYDAVLQYSVWYLFWFSSSLLLCLQI